MKSLKPLGKKGKVRSEKELLEELREVPTPPLFPLDPLQEEDYFELTDIVCIDADGNEFEKYDRIYVPRGVVTSRKRKTRSRLNSILLEHRDPDLFVPSLALTCNILARLFEEGGRHNYDLIKAILAGSEGLAENQNTMVNWEDKIISHYPTKEDDPRNLTPDINKDKNYKINTEIPLGGMYSLYQLQQKQYLDTFLRNCTGLKDPKILIEIGECFKSDFSFSIPHSVDIFRTYECQGNSNTVSKLRKSDLGNINRINIVNGNIDSNAYYRFISTKKPK